MFYSLCYPTLSDESNDFIQSFRAKHDLPFIDVVAHHFTIVFGVSDIEREVYFQHIKQQAKDTEVINFTCRYAMLGNDASNNNYYVYLVPDEGFSDISLLHDRMYRGTLEPFHRLDIPYIPHIGIATNSDPHKTKALCDELNATGLHIAGTLAGITLCEYDDSVINNLEYIPFDTVK